MSASFSLRQEVAGYVALFVRSVRANFTYRSSVLTSLVSAGISYAVPMLVWRHVYRESPDTPSVPSEGMFPYLVLAGCLNYALAMGVEARVGQRIRTGSIAVDLLKPIDFQLAQLSQALSDGLFNVVLCVPLLLVAYVALGSGILPANGVAFLAFLFSAALAFVILFSISFVFVQLAFFTYSGYGIFAARSALQQTFSGVSAPLALFPIWLRETSEYLPFCHTIHTPVAIYLGWLEGRELLKVLLLAFTWAVGLFVLGKLLLAFSLRRLEIQGG